MKTNFLKIVAILRILVGSFSGCKKKEEPNNEEPKEKFKNPFRDNIIGQWKLLKVSVNVNYEHLASIIYETIKIFFKKQKTFFLQLDKSKFFKNLGISQIRINLIINLQI